MNSGVSTMIAEVGSRKQPTINRMMLIAIRNAQGVSSSAFRACADRRGTPLMVRIQENSAAAATITRICAVSMAEATRAIEHVLPGHGAVDVTADEDRVEAGEPAGFGRREPAEIDAGQDEHRHEAAPGRHRA